jgi:hypothetical protein
VGTGIRGPSRAPCHAVRVEPADATTDGPFVRYRWPEVRARAGPVALHVPFEVEAGAPYLRNGWQSWSAPTRARYGGCRRHRPDPHDRIGRRHRFDRDWAGDESNDLLVGGGRVAGVVAHGALLVARPEHRDLLAIVEAPGPYPDVYVADADTPAVVGQLLARAGGRVPDDLPTGWCSWYGHYEHVTEPDIGPMLSDLRTLPEPIDLIQVDDGWQAAIGDWHTTSDAFPSGRSAIARHVPGLDPGSVSCLDNTWRAAKLRSLFHDRLWTNDPDCVLLRRTRTRLHRSERVGWARFVAASGQLLVDGDRLADLGPAELELWGELVRTDRGVRARRRASRVGV